MPARAPRERRRRQGRARLRSNGLVRRCRLRRVRAFRDRRALAPPRRDRRAHTRWRDRPAHRPRRRKRGAARAPASGRAWPPSIGPKSRRVAWARRRSVPATSTTPIADSQRAADVILEGIFNLTLGPAPAAGPFAASERQLTLSAIASEPTPASTRLGGPVLHLWPGRCSARAARFAAKG